MTIPCAGPLQQFHRPAGTGLEAPSIPLDASPIVSVIMTSFNSEQWINRALQSLFKQTWTNLDILLVDDASTDRTLKVALEASRNDTRLRVFRMEANAGTYTAKNEGMSVAKGAVITFMDSDDISQPDRIEKQLNLLRQKNLVATTCNFERRTGQDELVVNRGLAARQGLITLMFKRQVVDEIGWFDPVRTSADDEYFERIRHTYGRPAHANVADPLYIALHREASLSTSSKNAVLLTTDDQNDDGLTSARRAYVCSYRLWYEALAKESLRPFYPRHPDSTRPFPVESEISD